MESGHNAEEVFSRLRRSLKKWERSFLVENGRNPNKEDVQNASSEIQDLYQEYRQAKKSLNGHQHKIDIAESKNVDVKVIHEKKTNENPQDTEMGVFGTSLNKKLNKTTSQSSQAHAKTWKLPPLVSNVTSTRPRTWRTLPRLNSNCRPVPPLVQKESCEENSTSVSPEVKVETELQHCVPSTSDFLSNAPPLSQSRQQLKYESVSLSVLEKCDIESVKLVKGDSAADRGKPIRRSMGGGGIRRRDSCLARILGSDIVETENTDLVGKGSNVVELSEPFQESISKTTGNIPDETSSRHSISEFVSPRVCPLPSSSDVHVEHTTDPKDDRDVILPALPDEMELGHEDVAEMSQDCIHSAAKLPGSCVSDDCSTRLIDEGELSASFEVPANERADAETDELSNQEIGRHEHCKQVGGASKKSTGGAAVSENFRKLNMKVKRYTRRPGRGLTGERYKRMEWKKRQKEFDGSSCGRGRGGAKFVCFKCGETGHWARNCKGKSGFANLGNFDGEAVEYSELTVEEQMDLTALEELEKASPYPTIGEALKMAAGEKIERRMTTEFVEESKEKEEEGAEFERLRNSSPVVFDSDVHYPVHPHVSGKHPCPKTVEPLLQWEPGTNESTPSYVLEALEVLGFSSFRPCQREVVMRILSGRSTLMITATGSGKSLCYQLPAYLYRKKGRGSCFTLVVSPLVSLMDDQVLRLPPGLKGACLHTNKTALQREKVLQDLVKGKVDILYLSPEALVGGVLWKRRGNGRDLEDLPPIAFACIDEVHCISEWSHNFRPSYLRLYKTLRTCLGVECVLGLTATATHTTGLGVARQLNVADQDVVWGAAMPSNLHISVSRDEDRDLALVELLSREPYHSLDSIIIYCTRQQTTEGVAQMLRTSLQSWNRNETIGVSESDCLEESELDEQNSSSRGRKIVQKRKGNQRYGRAQKKKRSGAAILAECYHAGMSASQRRSVQNKFMRGDLRIVVATVAFGMGLDKSDVRAVIHYNMPQSMEAYVQEVGRAGRDGNPAYCHTFIDQEARDLSEMRRNIYANFVDLYTLKKFVEKVFPNSTVVGTNEDVPMDVAMDVEDTVENLDMTRECLETLLCYLELSGKVRLKGMVKDHCTVKCYGGSHQVKQLSWKVPAMAAAVATLTQKGMDLGDSKQVSFSISEVARSMGQDRATVCSELLGLQVNDRGTSRASSTGRSSVVVELGGLAFHLVVPSNQTCEMKEEAIELLHEKIKEQESLALEKLHLLHSILRQASKKTQDDCIPINSNENPLLENIQQYFSADSLSTSDLICCGIPVTTSTCEIAPEEEELIGRDVRTLVSRFSSEQFSGRSISRIFHGISSPRYPAIVWGAQRGFWRKYLHLDFHALCRVTTSHLVHMQNTTT